MASFRLKFEAGLHKRRIDVTYDLSQRPDALLLIGGSRRLGLLWKARRQGVRIVQRLDGINWVHKARWTGVRYHLRAEYGNALMGFHRNRFADRVIYQSEFIRGCWEAAYGPAHIPSHVILNGVDLQSFSPNGREIPAKPAGRFRLLVIEGSLAGGLNTGLFHAIWLAARLTQTHLMELVVAGAVDPRTRSRILEQSRVPVQFLGIVPRAEVPALARSAHLLFSAEINPPCPNSVMEALACGLPVVGFDTGSLSELVAGDAGRLVPYGGDPWKLTEPDIPALAQAAVEVLDDQARFRRAARARAEALLDVEKMVDAYIEVLLKQ